MKKPQKVDVSEIDDLTQWSKLEARDKDALAYFFKKYYSLLFNYGLKICASQEIVEDCIQDLFVKLWKRKKAIPEVESPRAYLLRSFKNNLLTRISKGDVLGDMDVFLFHHATESVQDKIIEDESLLEIRKKIDKSLDALATREREIIYLKFYKNMSYQEIAEVLDINYQSVRNSIHSAVKKLRKALIVSAIILLNTLY